MRAEKINTLRLYPEGRECQSPTTARIIEMFEPLQRHLLFDNAELVQTFAPQLTAIHTVVLRLLGLTPQAFQANSS